MEFIGENNIEYNTTPLKLGIKISNLQINGIDKGRHTKRGETKLYHIKKIMKHFKLNNDPFIEDIVIIEDEPKISKVKSSKKQSSIFILDI